MATPASPAEFGAQMAAVEARLAGPIPGAKAPRAFEEISRDEAYLAAREVAADDGRRALAVVRERAAEWGGRRRSASA